VPGSADPRSTGDLLNGPAVEVAPLLLGAIVRHRDVAVRLTEVEAYAGPDDPGSHAFRGRTARNATMFGPAGHLYCYLSHGLHVCANVTVGPANHPSAILLRAGDVVDGVEAAAARRPGSTLRDLARGPGRLCRALGLPLDADGTDLLVGGPLRLELPTDHSGPVERGPRTGLRRAADRPWRFWLAGEKTVSPYRRHPRAQPD
jgi:DNA-3-methyladenine glycosylase